MDGANGTDLPQDPVAPLMMSNASVRGPLVSVFVHYSIRAPTRAAERLQAIIGVGAASAGSLRPERVIVARVPPRLVTLLRSLPWIDSVNVGNDRMVLLADTVPWGVDSINADRVHDSLGNRGSGIKVAFLDSGVDCAHHDLAARLAGGYDFVLASSDYCGGGSHGTSVAGILAASVDGYGVVGVAPEAQLYAVRVCDQTGCPDVYAAMGLQWAIDNGMQVVNMSFGDCSSLAPEFINKITQAYNAGIVMVAAAGNGEGTCVPGGPVTALAARPEVIAVSAMYPNGSQLPGFNYGPEVDFAAPTDVRTDQPGGATAVNAGTSVAAPHVAGTVALLLRQGFTGQNLILQRLAETARDRGTPGRDNYYGYGSVDAGAAVVRAPSVVAVNGASDPITQPGSYTLTAAVLHGIPPLQVRWDVTYFPAVLPEVHTGYGSASYSVEIPSGEYRVYVTATPREATYQRVGFGHQRILVVCTDLNLRSDNGGSGPDTWAGCD